MDNYLLLFFAVMVAVLALVLILLYLKKRNRYRPSFNVIAIVAYVVTLVAYMTFFVYSF